MIEDEDSFQLIRPDLAAFLLLAGLAVALVLERLGVFA